MALTYRLHGLRVQSDVPLHERLSSPAEGAPVDVRIVVDSTGPAPGDPEGAVVAELKSQGQISYRIFRLPSGGHLLRAYGVSDFEISRDLGVIRCRPDPAIDRRWLPVLLRGTIIAALLDLRGRPTLHASAVEIGGQVIAFAGPSGSGKTTTAALFCAAGGRLVADDVLTVETSAGVPSCAVGSSELRLRDGAAGLIDEPGWVEGRRPLVDGRCAVQVRGADDPAGRLTAVIFPRPGGSADHPSVRRVRPADALLRLTSVARIGSWTSPDMLGQTFSFMSDLAAVVPVLAVDVPEGPPWRTDAVHRIVEAVEDAITSGDAGITAGAAFGALV